MLAFILSHCVAQTGGRMWMQFRRVLSHRSMVPLTCKLIAFCRLFRCEMTMFLPGSGTIIVSPSRTRQPMYEVVLCDNENRRNYRRF